MVTALRPHDVDVLVIEDIADPPKPDAIFPNNWISTTPDGNLFGIPCMQRAEGAEKRDDMAAQPGVCSKRCAGLEEFEAEGRFLRGTGSMVIDHANRLIYAAISERTNLSVLENLQPLTATRRLFSCQLTWKAVRYITRMW